MIKSRRGEGRPRLVQIRNRRSYDMTQAIDVQSREIRMIIPKSIKLGTHIQAAAKHAADDIAFIDIGGAAVVGFFSSQMRIKRNKSNFKRVIDVIVRIKTLGLLVKWRHGIAAITLIGQIRIGVGAFDIKAGFTDLLIIKDILNLRKTLNAAYLRVLTAGVDVKSERAVRHDARQ